MTSQRASGGGATTAAIAFGANLGDRHQTLAAAAREVAALDGVDGIRMSAPVESIAITVDGPDPTKPGYVNAVAVVTTTLSAEELLSALQGIESAHGRVREERWGDRTLDLDLIVFGDVVSDDPRLTLPHPRAHERDFVLGPWLEVDPDAVVPGRGSVAGLLGALRGQADRRGQAAPAPADTPPAGEAAP